MSSERIIEAVLDEWNELAPDAVMEYHTPEQVPLTAALVEVAKADDPEPKWWHGKEHYDAWRIRQEAHAALESALEANRG